MSTPDAAREAILRLVQPAANRRLLLVSDGIFEQRPGHSPRRIGQLFDQLLVLAASAPTPTASNVGVLERARRCAEQAEEFRFVLQELLPLLQSIAANPNSVPTDPQQTEFHLRAFEVQAASFLDVAGKRNSALSASGLSPKDRAGLARRIGVPCALVGTAVIPLQLVPRANPWDLHVTIGSQLFRYAIERARPLKGFLQAISGAEGWVPRPTLREPIFQERATELLASTQTLLSSCGFTGRRLQIPFRGAARFELQCQFGSWVLIYGPERPRTKQGQPLFVGVAIQGGTREARLSVAPIVASTALGFFMPNGELRETRICMGSREQYLHLCSPWFTDAEAIFYWLDATLTLATGRSAFHQKWREQTGRAPRRHHPLRPRRRRA